MAMFRIEQDVELFEDHNRPHPHGKFIRRFHGDPLTAIDNLINGLQRSVKNLRQVGLSPSARIQLFADKVSGRKYLCRSSCDALFAFRYYSCPFVQISG